jgi:single-stranded DNA-binding protein
MNYCNLIVKIIEPPFENYIGNKTSVVQTLVKFSPVKKGKGSEILNLIVWGNLAQDVIKYYKINDYIIVEGFLSSQKDSKNVYAQLSGRKVYPFILNTTTITETSLFK